MHCELVVPDLFALPPGERFPALELLLRRGRETHREGRTLEQWLAEAFGTAQPLPAGALTAHSIGLAAGAALWARADPVHLRLLRDRLILAPHGAFDIAADEARLFCEALNRHFGGALEFRVALPHCWVVRLDAAPGIDAPCPLDMAGRDVDVIVPRGAAAGGYQRLLNEAQMVLHAHPANEAREARGEPAVNSVWLWGAGSLPGTLTSPWQVVLGDDPVISGLARCAGARARAPGASASAWLDRAPEEGRQLAVLDALRVPFALSQEAEYRARLQGLERDWFAPLLAALRSGRIGMVTLHVPEAGASFETIRGDLRRFWRRARALESYA
ncbi:MAG TPA: hypothetical protein VHL85_07250 [Burkholderiales bacterium]|nr:hypothetical protein [Burkholderiales bacterium]